MKVKEIIEIAEAEVLAGTYDDDLNIDYCYSCDLMSDVLAYVENPVILITGLMHPQVLRTAEMLDIKAVIIVRGKRPSEELIEMAKTRNILLLATKFSMFTVSGMLYEKGLKGEETTHDEFTL